MNLKKGMGLSLLIISVSFAALMLIYQVNGPSWDLIVHYLNAKSMLNQQFLLRNYTVWGGLTIQKGTMYMETLRAGMTNAFMAPLLLVSRSIFLPYLAILYLLFIASILVAAKGLGADSPVMFALLLNPYFIYTSFVFSSEEILSLAFMLIGIGLLARRNAWAGLFIGLAGLSKYTALIFLPLVLALRKPTEIAKALAIFAIATAPWLLFNWHYFGGPLDSYTASLSVNVNAANPVAIFPYAILLAFAVPILYWAVATAISNGRIIRIVKRGAASMGQSRILCLSFLALAVVGYVAISFRHTFFDQIRYASFCVAGLLLLLAVLLKDSAMQKARAKTVMPAASLILMLAFISYFLYYSPYTLPYNVNSGSSVIRSSVSTIDALGYGSCRMVSNSWVYLIYYGIKAYAPFYANNITEATYPIAAFNSTFGVGEGYIKNINSSSAVYTSRNLSIYLPANHTCDTRNYD